MKKAVLFAMAALMVLQMPMVAMAHGHHGGGHHGCYRQNYAAPEQCNPPACCQLNPAVDGSYDLPMCGVEGCNHVAAHLHGNVYYCGHFDGDGCDYHQVCNVEGCLEVVEHEHDGVVCLPCR